MPRKRTVVEDDLQLKGGGLYCICPFEKLDGDNKSIFKIGYTTSYRKRIEQYHTLFVLGVYLVAFLQTPTAGRIKRVNGRYTKTITEYYHEIEKELIRAIIANGGKQITSTTRIQNLDKNNQGESEWFYMNDTIINNSFDQIKSIYGGKYAGDGNEIYDLSQMNANAKKTSKKFDCSGRGSSKTKKCYKAEIYYPLPYSRQ